MSKYIDADKLKAEIERYENTAIDAYNPHGEDAEFWHGKVVACEDLKTLVTSLQQEQPHFADASKMEQPDMNIEWFRLAEDYTMHLDFSYCKTCDWMLHIWKKGCGANGEDLIIFNEQDTNPNLLLAKGENALKKWLLDNNINAALTPR